MSIYNRDEVFPEWEPIPWSLTGEAADQQEMGFHARACKPIVWRLIPFNSFPNEGVFEHDRDWFIENDIACYATFDGEDLILIRNTWHGFPDPPEWGLASRPAGQLNIPWQAWGHFPTPPNAWIIPNW